MAKIFFILTIAISKLLLFCFKLTAVVVMPLIHQSFMQVSLQFIYSDLSKFYTTKFSQIFSFFLHKNYIMKYLYFNGSVYVVVVFSAVTAG